MIDIQVWDKILTALAPALGVGSLLILGAFLIAVVGKRLVRKLQFNEDARSMILKTWQEVERHIKQTDETHLRMAVIKADAALDLALKAKHFPGRSMTDRLNFGTHKYRNLKKVRSAHGLRNVLTHEPLRTVTQNQVLGAVASFREALRELGAL
jgi:hypothetical protein